MYFQYFLLLQKLAADFLSNYIFLAIGRVGSSTELIVQKVELVQEMEKRDLLVDLLRSQRANGFNGKVRFEYIFDKECFHLLSLLHECPVRSILFN